MGKCTVLIQTIQKRDDNRESASAQKAAGREAVFRAKDCYRDKYPKGRVIILHATIHSKPPVFFRGSYVEYFGFVPADVVFLIHNILL